MSLNLTIRNERRFQYEDDGLSKNENRSKLHGGLSILKKDTFSSIPTAATFTPRAESILRPGVNAGIQNDANFIEATEGINFASVEVNKFNPTIRNSYNSCTLPATLNVESTFVTFSKQTLGFDIALEEDTYMSNEWKGDDESIDDAMMKDYMIQYERGCEFMAESIDNNFLTILDAGINQYWPAGGPTKFYPQIGNELQVAAAEQERYFYRLPSIMKEMQFRDEPIRVLHDSLLESDIRQWMAQGTANAENLNAQFRPGQYDFNYTDVGLIPGVGQSSVHYALAPYQTFITYRVQKKYEMGKDRLGGSQRWSMVSGTEVPFVQMPLSELYTDSCIDSERGAGFGHTWQYQLEVVVGLAYNSNPAADYSPYLKTAFLL